MEQEARKQLMQAAKAGVEAYLATPEGARLFGAFHLVDTKNDGFVVATVPNDDRYEINLLTY